MNPARAALLALAACLSAPAPGAVAADPFPVTIQVQANQPQGEFKPLWRFFGADEPNYATMKNGRQLLAELGRLRPDDVYFRTHNLLTSGDGSAALKWGSTGVYSQSPGGAPVYHWTILDGIFDTYRANGIQPYVEIGFMPESLSTHPEPYRHHWDPAQRYQDIFTGWAWPPKDYGQWSSLVYAWTRHDLARYGAADLARWYWETWNEPNIGYWQGSRADFFKLHDYAIAGVRRAFPQARVGGPDSAGGGSPFLRAFLEHCLHGTNYATGRIGTPLDFISFHAKGSPGYTNDHVRMGISSQLRNMDSAFRIIAAFPALKNTPVIIGESDPDGCAACQGDQLGYRNGTIYASYTAATLAREFELAGRAGVNLQGSLTWAFEFEDEPPFAGFRVLASDGIDLPVLNLFRLLAKMNGRRIAVHSSAEIPLAEILRHGVRGQPDVSALASLDAHQLAVLIWHYHDDEIPGPDAAIQLQINGLGSIPSVLRRHYRIDDRHSNAFSAWKRMNAPLPLSAAQVADLQQQGQLAELDAPARLPVTKGGLSVDLNLPREAVSLLVFTW